MECLNHLINHPISIHAPREGCDRKAFKSISKAKHFNPRTPRGVRQGPSGRCSRDSDNFNPRTPRGVRPRPPPSLCHSQSISIHAPREGCDCRSCTPHAPAPDFNPRTPRGVRHDLLRQYGVDIWDFNPRTPRGVRLGVMRATEWCGKFQSTHPARGATLPMQIASVLPLFQSTHPARGATTSGGRPCANLQISIHAPREGCDVASEM